MNAIGEIPSEKETRIGASIEESVRRMVFRAYEGGKNASVDLKRLEDSLAVGVLASVSEELNGILEGKGTSISELSNRIREMVRVGLSSAVSDSRAGNDMEERRIRAAAAFVKTRAEKKIAIVSELGPNMAMEFAIRKSEEAEGRILKAEKNAASASEETERLRGRFQKLNGTLQEALRKFSENRSSLLRELDEAKTVAERASAERDAAKTKEALAVRRAEEAERETESAKRAFSKVSAKAKEAERAEELLKKHELSAGNLETGILELITDYERALGEIEGFSEERISFQKATERVFVLEKRVYELENAKPKAKTAASDGGDDEINRTKSDIEYAAGAYLDAAIRLYGDSPDLRNYADCEKYSKELRALDEKAKSMGIDTFALAEKAFSKTRDDWMKAAEARKKLGLSNLSVQKAYEEGIREIGTYSQQTRSMREIASSLKFYDSVAGLGRKYPHGLKTVEPEAR